MPAAEAAAMASGMDAAYAAAATVGEGADNGAAIVDPRDGRVRDGAAALCGNSCRLNAALMRNWDVKQH